MPSALQRDVETMLHEAGHAFHALATREEDLYAYRSAPIEFCEVASMSMELLGNEFLEEFYSPDDAKRARREHLEGIVEFSLDRDRGRISALDLLASRPHAARNELQAWLALDGSVSAVMSIGAGTKCARANLWHRQLHIFLHPFYYVEYGIAQLGALQVWANSKTRPSQGPSAITRRVGPGRLATAAGIFSPPPAANSTSPGTVKPLIELVRSELAKL